MTKEVVSERKLQMLNYLENIVRDFDKNDVLTIKVYGHRVVARLEADDEDGHSITYEYKTKVDKDAVDRGNSYAAADPIEALETCLEKLSMASGTSQEEIDKLQRTNQQE